MLQREMNTLNPIFKKSIVQQDQEQLLLSKFNINILNNFDHE